MKKLLLLFFALLTAAGGAWASKTFTISAQTGQFYKSGNTELTWSSEGGTLYGNAWYSTDVNPDLMLYTNSGNNNIVIDAQFRIHTDTYVLDVPMGYKITAWSITAYTESETTSTIDGTVISTDSANPTTVSQSGLSSATTSFQVSTASPWIVVKTFTVEVDDDFEALINYCETEYNTLLPNAGKVGYPSASALATYKAAIDAAKNAVANNDNTASIHTSLPAASEAVKSAANIVYTPRTDVYYTIVNARGAMVYDPTKDEVYDATNGNANYIWFGSATPDETEANNLWGFIEQDGNYYMYNVGKKQFASVGTGTGEHNYGKTWIFSDAPAYITLDNGIAHEIAVPKVRVRATVATTGDSYTMSVSTSYTGPVITYDGNGDGGVPMLFTESSKEVDASLTAAMREKVEDPTPYRNALKKVIDAAAAIPFGTKLGEYVSNATYTAALEAANTAYANASATISELKNATTTLEGSFATLEPNMPVANTFLRIQNVVKALYISGDAATYNGYTGYLQNKAVADASTIFFYDGTYLYDLANGRAANGVNTGTAGKAGMAYTFGKATYHANGYGVATYAVRCGDKYARVYGDPYYFMLPDNSSNGENQEYYIEEVTELPVSISDLGYATLYTPVALTVPSGVKAYTGVVNGNELNMTEVATIPANTAVVLKGAEGTYDFAITTGGTAGSNVLKGSVGGVAVEAKSVLTLQNIDEAGFYTYTGTAIPGFKAYLTLDAEVKGLSLNFGDETAILGVAEEQGDAVVYNLAGQRVAKPVRGLYIVNGKKIMVK